MFFCFKTTTQHILPKCSVQYSAQYSILHQWVDDKAPPAQVAEGNTTTNARGMFTPVERRETPQAQGTKVRASIGASRYRMQQQHATTTTTTANQSGPAQHNAAISATCIRARFVYRGMVSPHASWTDCCIVLCCSYLGGSDGGCICLLLLHPVPMLALTFAPCACGVFLLSTGGNISHAQQKAPKVTASKYP